MWRFYPIFLLFCAHVVGAQSFQATPAPVRTQEMAFQQANEVYLHFDNPSGDSLRLRWRLLEISAPPAWQFDLCDYGTCYTSFPSNGWMNYVYDTIQPYLKLIVQPGLSPGNAWLWYRVFEAQDETNFVDVYFSLFTAGITAALGPVAPTVRIFPNPAQDFLWIDNPTEQDLPVRCSNRVGQVIFQQLVPARSNRQFEVRDLPAGIYYLQTTTSNFTVLIQH